VSAQQWWQIKPAEVPLLINSSLAKDSGHIHNEFCTAPLMRATLLVKLITQ